MQGQGVAAIILLKSGPQELTEPARSDIARLEIHHYYRMYNFTNCNYIIVMISILGNENTSLSPYV